MTAEPLHVRVAVALGWTDVQSIGPRDYGPAWHTPGEELWVGVAPGKTGGLDVWAGDRCFDYVPPYGQDSPEGWAAHGFLIVKYGLCINPVIGGAWRCEACECFSPRCVGQDHDIISADGATPSEALATLVCDALPVGISAAIRARGQKGE